MGESGISPTPESLVRWAPLGPEASTAPQAAEDSVAQEANRNSWEAVFRLPLTGTMDGEKHQANQDAIEPIHFSEGLTGGKLGGVDFGNAGVELHYLVGGQAMSLSGWRLEQRNDDTIKSRFEVEGGSTEGSSPVTAGEKKNLVLIHRETNNRIVLSVEEREDEARYQYKRYEMRVIMTRGERPAE